MVFLQPNICSRRKDQVMAHFKADHCEKKLASRRQEVPKKYSQMEFCNAYIYDTLSHMLRMSSPENAKVRSLC
jgi:hypothetical protein